jgi:hypothetical protein
MVSTSRSPWPSPPQPLHFSSRVRGWAGGRPDRWFRGGRPGALRRGFIAMRATLTRTRQYRDHSSHGTAPYPTAACTTPFRRTETPQLSSRVSVCPSHWFTLYLPSALIRRQLAHRGRNFCRRGAFLVRGGETAFRRSLLFSLTKSTEMRIRAARPTDRPAHGSPVSPGSPAARRHTPEEGGGGGAGGASARGRLRDQPHGGADEGACSRACVYMPYSPVLPYVL